MSSPAISAYAEKQMSSLDWQTRHQQPSPDSILILLKHLPGSYNINKTPAISDADVVEAVSTALCKVPRRDETTKFVILMKKDYDAFVELVKAAHAKKRVTKDRARVEALNKGYGCILFFTDYSPLSQPVLEGSNAQPPKEKPNKKDVENAVNRQVYLVGKSLCKAGCGTNLQQFDSIDKLVHDRWAIPSAWKLHTQMIFGGLECPKPPVRTLAKKELKQRVMVFPLIPGIANGDDGEACVAEHTDASTPWFGKGKKSKCA